MMTANTEPTRDTGPLDALFATARRHESALRLALQVGDPIAGLVTAARLAQALRRVSDALDAISAGVALRGALLAVFQDSTRGMYELLRRVPTETAELDARRVTRWLRARGRSALAPGGPDLFELDATGIAISAAQLLGLHVARCRFITAMPGASFLGALIEQCDFTYGSLRNTLWQHSHADHSFFRDSSLVDATFDHASFVDCDLRRADFSVLDHHGLATITNVQFLRCDLRGTLWTGRDLSRVRLVACQLDDLAEVADSSQLAAVGRLARQSKVCAV